MKTTAQMIKVMQAYEDGKVIECRNIYDQLINVYAKPNEPSWDWVGYDYIVKEEPKYRPYESTEEMIDDFCERCRAKRSPMGEPYIWVKDKKGGKLLITGFDEENATVRIVTIWDSMNQIFANYTYLDGSPCGKKIEE